MVDPAGVEDSFSAVKPFLLSNCDNCESVAKLGVPSPSSPRNLRDSSSSRCWSSASWDNASLNAASVRRNCCGPGSRMANAVEARLHLPPRILHLSGGHGRPEHLRDLRVQCGGCRVWPGGVEMPGRPHESRAGPRRGRRRSANGASGHRSPWSLQTRPCIQVDGIRRREIPSQPGQRSIRQQFEFAARQTDPPRPRSRPAPSPSLHGVTYKMALSRAAGSASTARV